MSRHRAIYNDLRAEDGYDDYDDYDDDGYGDEERRVDENDGVAYTYQEFLDEYGGTAECKRFRSQAILWLSPRLRRP